MRHLLAAALLIYALPSYAITGYRPPDEFIGPLVDNLLEDMKTILQISLPLERPTIYLTNREQIMEAYCEAKYRCNVVAVTDNKTGVIYLDAKTELNNIYSVSVLYHELVHFVQIKNNMFNNLDDCNRWAASEMHAYKAQSDWLIYHNMRGFKVPDLSQQCKK